MENGLQLFTRVFAGGPTLQSQSRQQYPDQLTGNERPKGYPEPFERLKSCL